MVKMSQEYLPIINSVRYLQNISLMSLLLIRNQNNMSNTLQLSLLIKIIKRQHKWPKLKLHQIVEKEFSSFFKMVHLMIKVLKIDLKILKKLLKRWILNIIMKKELYLHFMMQKKRKLMNALKKSRRNMETLLNKEHNR